MGEVVENASVRRSTWEQCGKEYWGKIVKKNCSLVSSLEDKEHGGRFHPIESHLLEDGRVQALKHDTCSRECIERSKRMGGSEALFVWCKSTYKT